MKEIVILSGKGGTGKTSVAGALAILAGKEAVIGDCDVDAANMHLLLNPDFHHGDDFYGGLLATIDKESCTSCGLCKEKCRFDAITSIDGAYDVTLLDCEGCGYCSIVCPADAIAMVPRKTGRIYVSETRAENLMVHADMEPGAENSGKMVTRIKQESRKIAKKNGQPYIIIDGSPGLGCPVVASLSGANLVVLVTEPTLSAMHDLKRVNEVIKNFGIKTVCVINKRDINPTRSLELEEFLRTQGITHIANIPYDTGIPIAMADMLTMAETGTEISLIINEIWERIKNELS
jgi:MinD superfamily P-loop ATPase